MFEKRVVRGNTYSSYMVAQREMQAMESAKKRNTRNVRRAQEENYHDVDGPNEYEYNEDEEREPPLGCRNADVYTDENVETETDLPPCHDATTQTEFVIEKKLPDLSMPVYTGIHKETQIYASENLFDFDYEAEPVVQVLVTRCLEESRIEVVEEEELRVLKQRQEYLKNIECKEEQERRDLENRERQKDQENKDKNVKRRRRKEELIDSHQHMIARVYTKRFFGDVASSAFEILENMCMFMDEEEKEIKDEFMPWLYDQTLALAIDKSEKSKEADHLIKTLEDGMLATHRHSVYIEMEKRRVAKEEEERLLKEREERRRAKLEYKLKRREDRRLYYIENDLFEYFVNKGEFDNEIVNISEFDGSDAAGNKSIGFRGGLIGELYLFMKKIQEHAKFQEVQFDRYTLGDIWESIFSNFVTQGWTVYVGLKMEFERNYRELIDEFDFGTFDLDYVRSIDDPEEYESTIDFVVKHFTSAYFNNVYPKLVATQEKELEKLRPVEPEEEEEQAEEEQGEEEGEEEGQGEEEQQEGVEEAKEEGQGEEEQQEGEQEGEGEEEEIDIEYRQFREFVENIIRKIFDKNSGIKNVKFNLTEEFEEEVKNEEADEGSEDDEEDQPETNAKPLALCVFVPEPEPEEEEEEGDEENKKDGEAEEEQEQDYEEQSVEGREEGEEEEKEPEEVYLKPFMPKEEFFTQSFNDDITQIEHILNNMRVQSIHYPLLTKFRSSLLEIITRVTKIEMEEEEVAEFLKSCNLQTVEEIKKYAEANEGLDLMYLNVQ